MNGEQHGHKSAYTAEYIPILAIEVATVGTNDGTGYFFKGGETNWADVVSGDVTAFGERQSICEALE